MKADTEKTVPKHSDNVPNWFTIGKYSLDTPAPVNFDRDGETGKRESFKAKQKVGFKGGVKAVFSCWGSIIKSDAMMMENDMPKIAGMFAGLVKNPALAAMFPALSVGLSDMSKGFNTIWKKEKPSQESLVSSMLKESIMARQAAPGSIMF